MIWRRGLGHQIWLSMSGVTIAIVMIAFFGVYAIYMLLFDFVPQLVDEDDYFLSGTDILILAVLSLVALLVAGLVSLKLAARILVPLNSLAESARRIAAGDLTARAIPGDRSLGETAHLVADFNAMAEKLQAMADDMVAWNAAIAHELRSPLTILKGKLQGIVDGVFTPDEKLIHSLLQQTEALSRLVDDLRLVTLADGSRLELEIAPVNLAHQIRTLTDLVKPDMREKGYSFDLDLADLIVPVDTARIRQALIAILDNAQRYANPGSIEIALRKQDEMALIRVEDSGPGLPPEYAKRAFEPFTRGDASRSRQFGGSGLGLSVVRAIAEAHSGTATYHTSSHGGAVFEIALPLCHKQDKGPVNLHREH